jgi:hypothetical protein
MPSLALHNLKPVLDRCKRTKNDLTFRVVARVRSSSWFGDTTLGNDLGLGARIYDFSGHQFSAVGSRNYSKTAIDTAENAKLAKKKDYLTIDGSTRIYSSFDDLITKKKANDLKLLVN